MSRWSIALVLLLVAILVFGVGAAVGVNWSSALEVRWARTQRDWDRYVQRRADPAAWVRDSVRLAEWEAHGRTLDAPLRPREVSRTQIATACAVGFQFRDTTYQQVQAFYAQASPARGNLATTVGTGWAFNPRGFHPGDTVFVVLPDLWCGDLVIMGYGGGLSPAPHHVGIDVH